MSLKIKSPEGGQISRYTDGEPNGELIDRARTLVSLPTFPRRSKPYDCNLRS